MKIAKHIYWTLVFLIAFQLACYSQSLPVGTPAIEDYYRRAQLTGQADTNVSFTIRPLFPGSITKGADPFYPDSTEAKFNLLNTERYFQNASGTIKGSLLPITSQYQFNTHHPYGWNDGAMIPAKGLQNVISAGIFAQYGPLTIQFKPEVVLAQNSDFESFNANHYDVIFARYYDIYNNIDLPVRFGVNNYVRLNWGQSSIRLNHKGISFGLSTENLWWGPGMRNSLLMSNTAPGFAHLTLNTLRPVKTPIGTFEAQLIAGRLENSGFAPLTPDHYFFGTNLNVPKPNDWRYLSGLIVTWQPKWIKGLFLGFDKSAIMYGKDINGIKDYLPVFTQFKKVNSPTAQINKKDQMGSMFMRWLWTEEHAEIYFQYGQYNFEGTLTQALLSPNDSRAYIFGLRKLLPFNKSRNESILIGIEAAQFQVNSLDLLAQGKQWYVGKWVRQGYTNMGEALGAGIGPGANLQTVNVSWVKGLKRLGIELERYVHNNDFYYYAYIDSGDPRRHWVDLSLAAHGEWNYKNLIFNARLQAIRSLNYQWYLRQNPGDDYWVNGKDVTNVQIQAGVTYRF
ncbi:capsule assembly Wzi family protein [Mucilaginibacter calamicampi]|uniref:Capsule assembly Wzi family protein n=1 Tax=Mucilaginibacter calamicampi TaxID=1302352 RepID=A0ABW2YYA9_9SPHI